MQGIVEQPVSLADDGTIGGVAVPEPIHTPVFGADPEVPLGILIQGTDQV